MRRRVFWHCSRCTPLEKESNATIIPSPCRFSPHLRCRNHQTNRRKPNCRSAAHVPHWNGAESRKHVRQQSMRRECGRRRQMAHRGEGLKYQASTRYRKRTRETPSKRIPIHRAPAIILGIQRPGPHRRWVTSARPKPRVQWRGGRVGECLTVWHRQAKDDFRNSKKVPHAKRTWKPTVNVSRVQDSKKLRRRAHDRKGTEDTLQRSTWLGQFGQVSQRLPTRLVPMPPDCGWRHIRPCQHLKHSVGQIWVAKGQVQDFGLVVRKSWFDAREMWAVWRKSHPADAVHRKKLVRRLDMHTCIIVKQNTIQSISALMAPLCTL